MQAQRIPIKKVKVNPEKLQSTAAQFASALAESADLKYLAQKSFITYMRSVFLQSDKTIFNVLQIDAEKLSAAMGLPGTPNMKFAKGSTHGDKNETKPANSASGMASHIEPLRIRSVI